MYTADRHRTLSALAALAIVAGGAFALLLGLGIDAARQVAPDAPLEAILPTRDRPPPPPPEARQPKRPVPPEAPAPAARRNQAAPIVAPSPPLPPLIDPPPVPTAPRAGTGSAGNQGASDRDGSGWGAGGSGNGTGGGGNGGSGSGSGNADVSAYPRQVAGKLHYWEIPKELREDHGGVIRLRYRIGTDGTVSGCTVLQSSGLPQFDRDTCSRITERFRFKPARDRSGNPVAFVMTETHGWDYAPPSR